jgi:hypothetical protein
MTEAEWLACKDRDQMLVFLQHKVSDRKLRLFACACCRHIWDKIEDEESRKAVLVAEGYADGLASDAELAAAAQKAAAIAEAACDAVIVPGDVWQSVWVPAQAALTARFASILKDDQDYGAVVQARDIVQNTIFHARVVADQSGRYDPLVFLHEMFGNPFRPVTINPAWQTSNVVAIAQTIYDERGFADMPVLGDALEDAGCDNADILNHCRQLGEHVRGCWVVDLILAKS